MVVHDRERVEEWAIKQRMHNDTKPTLSRNSPRKLTVIGVQCLACGVVVLLALFLRMAGGTVYTQLQKEFAEALAGNELMTVFMRLWDDGVDDILFDAEDDMSGEGWTSTGIANRFCLLEVLSREKVCEQPPVSPAAV